MESKSSSDSNGPVRGPGDAPPARPPRPAHLTVPNLMSTTVSKYATKKFMLPNEPESEQERLLLKSGIAFNRSERATKFTYSAETGRWEMASAKFKIAKESFAEGGMRRSYRALEMNSDGTTNALVVKLFKDPRTKPAVVFHEALTQAVAEKYAQGFNNLCQRKGLLLRIKFLPVWVVHLTERSMLVDGLHHDTYATVEPFLPGSYIKLSDNSGRHLDDIPAQAAQTFSHYSFLASGRQLVCVDIQGVSELASVDHENGSTALTAKALSLTDPQIHSIDGTMFGSGNLGVGGINAFIASYKRTMFDEQLGLAPLTAAMMLEVKRVNPVKPLPPVPEAPPFDTAELASRLSEDERLAREEEGDEVSSLPASYGKPTGDLTNQMDQLDLSGRISYSEEQRRASSRERHSSRILDFATGGEVARLSIRAREYTKSISEIL